MSESGVVVLTGEEYWELRSRAKDVECAELLLALTPHGQQLRAARAEATRTLDALIAKYGLDASETWTLDEVQKALVPTVPQTPPK